MAERVAERRADNIATIDAFVFAARYRYESYGYALDNLLVETPHENSIEVDALLTTMSGFRRQGGVRRVLRAIVDAGPDSR